MSLSIQSTELELSFSPEQLMNLDINDLESPVLSRLVEEVRNDSESTVHSYDRAHNRHNR